MSMSSNSANEFNACVYVSEQLNRLIVNSAQELSHRVVMFCGEKYGFDGEEAIRLLGLNMVRLERNKKDEAVVEKAPKREAVKASFPLPYNGESSQELCQALRQNSGLYTQCQVSRKGEKPYCKSCQALADKSADGVPEYGTIVQRSAVDIFEYVDPKGRKPVAYVKVMNKHKITQEQVVAEACKFDITVNDSHFVISGEAKKGRPASKKEAVPKEAAGAKGRPKKSKKVIMIADDEDDLFASLVAQVNTLSIEDEPEEDAEHGESLAQEAELQKEIETLENAKKAAKKVVDEESKAAKKAADEESKAAKKAADEEAKAAKKAAEEEAKKSKKPAAKAVKAAVVETKEAEEAEEEAAEPDVVKKIKFVGKAYLQSKKTGIVYDYDEYLKNQKQIAVGHWNEEKSIIEFSTKTEESDEESEDEYDEE